MTVPEFDTANRRYLASPRRYRRGEPVGLIRASGGRPVSGRMIHRRPGGAVVRRSAR